MYSTQKWQIAVIYDPVDPCMWAMGHRYSNLVNTRIQSKIIDFMSNFTAAPRA